LATPEKGVVSAILLRPLKSTHLLVLGHGASTNMNHQTLQNIASSLAASNIATFRYNFPYSENGTGRDSNATCVATVRSAVAAAHEAAPELPILAGGHSFGGRMTSMAQSEEPLEFVTGIIFFSFPLHLPDRPAMARAEHLSKVRIPMLFLSGTRDKLAEISRLKQVCEGLGDLATLHWLDTADHGYKIQKRNRRNTRSGKRNRRLKENPARRKPSARTGSMIRLTKIRNAGC
jgi:uncharacterized protein